MVRVMRYTADMVYAKAAVSGHVNPNGYFCPKGEGAICNDNEKIKMRCGFPDATPDGIIRAMEPNSLLLLNETFQTTAYDEGADGMIPILNYLGALGCGIIFVTHLTRLVERCRNTEGVAVMRTSEDPRTRYKLSRI